MKGDEIYCWGIDVIAYYPEQKKACIQYIKDKDKDKDKGKDKDIPKNIKNNMNDLNQELQNNIKLTTRIINGVKISNI